MCSGYWFRAHDRLRHIAPVARLRRDAGRWRRMAFMERGDRFEPRGHIVRYSCLPARPFADGTFLSFKCASASSLGPFQRVQARAKAGWRHPSQSMDFGRCGDLFAQVEAFPVVGRNNQRTRSF
jgi:hypothetical protein